MGERLATCPKEPRPRGTHIKEPPVMSSWACRPGVQGNPEQPCPPVLVPTSLQGSLPGFRASLPMCAPSDRPGEDSVGLLGVRSPQKDSGPQESAAVPGKETFWMTRH